MQNYSVSIHMDIFGFLSHTRLPVSHVPHALHPALLQPPELVLFRAPRVAVGRGVRPGSDRVQGRSPGFGSQETSVFCILVKSHRKSK